MSNVTVIRRSEQTDVTGKLVIENILEEMKEAGPSNGPGTGSLVTSAVFTGRGLHISSKDVPEYSQKKTFNA